MADYYQIVLRELIYLFELIAFGYQSSYPSLIDIDRPNGLPHYIFVYFRTPCIFQERNGNSNVNNHFVLLEPNVAHRYFSQSTPHIDDWIHFGATMEGVNIITQLHIRLNSPVFLDNYSRCAGVLSQLQSLSYCNQEIKGTLASALITTLLCELSTATSINLNENVNHNYYKAFHDLRTLIYQKPERGYTVKKLAEKSQLSVSRFQHIYKDIFRQTPGKDIALSRLERAKYLLESSNLSIAVIAENCGYTNEIHMIRHFRRYLNDTPTGYRKSRRL